MGHEELAQKGFAKYFFMKRCCNCFFVQVTENTKCSHCGNIFYSEANQKEIQEANDRLVEMQTERWE